MLSISTNHNPDPVDGELRATHFPQIPGTPFEVQVDSIAEGRATLDLLAEYDLFQFDNRIKPDYSNMGLLVRYDAEAADWEEVDEEEADHAD